LRALPRAAANRPDRRFRPQRLLILGFYHGPKALKALNRFLPPSVPISADVRSYGHSVSSRGADMFFLIRFAIKFCFWMWLVSLFMPNLAGDDSKGPGAIEALIAAQETISDLSGFCERKPDACATGKAALADAGLRAGEAAKAGFDYLGTRLADTPPDPDAAVAAAHQGSETALDGESLKARLRDAAMREIISSAKRQYNAGAEHTGSVKPTPRPTPKPTPNPGPKPVSAE
jgi:hypothetical protein